MSSREMKKRKRLTPSLASGKVFEEGKRQRGTERMGFNMRLSRAVGRYFMKGREEIDKCKRDSKMLAW